VDVNVPGVMLTLVAPAVAQFSALLVPEFMLAGVAVKDVMVGAEPFPPVEGLDEVPGVQLDRPKQAIRVRTSAHRSSPEELSPVKPGLFPQ
jgi:hypothetical protein